MVHILAASRLCGKKIAQCKMSAKPRTWLGTLLVAAGLAFLAWLCVWGFAVSHPESGVSERAAVPTMLAVLVLVLVYYGARSVLGKPK